MTPSGPHRVGQLSAEIVRRLGGRLDQLTALRLCWAAAVGEPMAQFSEPLHYAGGCLTVAVASSAWASRLRQQQGALAQTLRQQAALRELREIRVRIQPQAIAPATRTPPVRRASRIPVSAARQLRALATTTRDPALRAALERLGGAKVSEPD